MSVSAVVGGASWRALPPRARWILFAAVVGLLVRPWLALMSNGSNDVTIWSVFAQHIEQHGLIQTYLDLDGRPGSPVPVFNHPPIPGLWVTLCWIVAKATGVRFAILLKVAGILAEFGTAALLWKIWSKRSGPLVAATAVATFSWGLCSILVSGYHGNTDCAYAFLLLLAVYFFQEGRPFLAGAVLAGAINIKLIPVFALPALFAATRDWKTFFRLSAGLSLTLVPFVPLLLTIPERLIKSVVGYTPNLEHWGIIGLLLASSATRRFNEVTPEAIQFYSTQYRFVLVLAIGAAAAWAWRTKASVLESALIGLCLFMIFTPGFGVQYTAVLCPLMFAVNYRWGLAWSSVAGLFIFVPYFVFIDGSIPWNSTFTSRYPMPAPMVGLVAWALLIQLSGSVMSAWRRPAVP